MQAFLETVIKGLVSRPEDVRVTAMEGRHGTLFEVRVHPDDIGRLVGRRGNTINAVRTLLTAGAAKRGLRCSLELVDAPEVPQPEAAT